MGGASMSTQYYNIIRSRLETKHERRPVARGGGSTGSIETPLLVDRTPLSRSNPPNRTPRRTPASFHNVHTRSQGPKVLFLNLHACHCMWNPSLSTFDITKKSLKYAFSKLFWGGAQPAPPQTSPHSISGCALDSSFAPILGCFALSIPGFAFNSPPLKCLLIPPQQKGTRSNTVPQPQILVFPNTGPKITFQEYVVGLIYTIEKIIDSS